LKFLEASDIYLW